MPARSCEGVARSVSRHNLLAMRFNSIPLVLFVLIFYVKDKFVTFGAPLFFVAILWMECLEVSYESRLGF